ncbi:DUF1579 family protein [Taibaiella helva]|uniref:DUF1579 family protein n=1 Tax=Taibaiella helva TaxID=2301235 RepID=UPI000E574E02|nr:DUF1579 family protein [Taibaiella helva]
MKALLTAILLLLLPYPGLLAQDNEAAKAAAASSPEHIYRFLARYEGTWTVEVSEWSQAEADPEKYTLTAVLNMVLGDRFLQWSQTGVGPRGAFEEWATLGYDEPGDRFSLVWLSSAGTANETAQGSWTEAGRSASLSPVCDAAGGHRYIIRFMDKDNFQVEQYQQGAGEAFKTREYHYSRQ